VKTVRGFSIASLAHVRVGCGQSTRCAYRRRKNCIAIVALCLFAFGGAVRAGTHDFDGNGYVNIADYARFEACLGQSGPGGNTGLAECFELFDADSDGDVDLADFSSFQRARGHLPMPLKDVFGNAITIASSNPYNGRQTCGPCHDVARISNGFLFQQGRTDTSGRLDMRDDYHGDGRFWIKSSGRYGKWGQSFRYLLAAQDNVRASDMDQTAFAWVRDCGACHPGGGPGEYDRNNMPFFDRQTGRFGYEALGKTPEDMLYSGDYALIDYATGALRPAPWNVTGLSGPDCLQCHRTQRTIVNGRDMNFTWRQSVLAAGERLVDDAGLPVPAFEAAATAGQGWFSRLQPSAVRNSTVANGFPGSADMALLTLDQAAASPAAPPVLQIDYNVGVGNGSLACAENGSVQLTPQSLTWPPKDRACWGCHPFQTITGTLWFDNRDVLYRYFNRLSDGDPNNDIAPENSRVCTVCHIGDLNHNFGRGNSLQIHYRDDLDWQGIRNCRSCHLATLPDGQPNPGKHPAAPEFPGAITIHLKMESPGETVTKVSCQACHIPYALAPALLFRDITIPGATGTTSQYLSADPLDPANPDKSRWYPAFAWKTDVDGNRRLFPVNYWISIYWGNWDQRNTPDDLSDDIISPIPLWRVTQVIPQPLPIVTDDNGDGQLEINRPEEILAYLQLLKTPDSYGVPVAANPVLVKGPRVWYEKADAPGGVDSFDHRNTGMSITFYPYIWSLDHNVLPVAESLGYAPNHGPEGCSDCHRPATHDAPVWDRLILVDPYGPDGKPVYETVRQMTGVNPP